MPLASIGYLVARPRLWRWVLIPFVLNVVLFVSLAVTVSQVIVLPLVEWMKGYLSWLDGVMGLIVVGIMMLFAMLALGLVSFFLFSLIASPFNDFLSEDIEREYFGEENERLIADSLPLLQSILHSLKEALVRLSVVAPLLMIGFLAGFIPIIGPMIAGGAALANGVIFLSVDGYSYSLDRRGYKLRAKLAWLRAHPGEWLPFGLGLALLFLIPCNALFMPMLSAVAATRLYCEVRLRESQVGTALAEEGAQPTKGNETT
jgi:CysZ protein